jgi:hypothetical protein
MAIVDEFDVCALCSGKLDRPYKGLSNYGFSLPKEIERYCDDVMHMDCFENWEHRLQFSHDAFRGNTVRWLKSSPSVGYLLLKADSYILVCGPTGPHTANTTDLGAAVTRAISGWRADEFAPLFTSIFLRDWDLGLRSNWFDWYAFLNYGYKKRLEGLSEDAKAEIDAIVDEVRKQIPDLPALWEKLQEKLPKDEPN